MAISNQHFEYFKEQKQKILESKAFLQENGYIVRVNPASNCLFESTSLQDKADEQIRMIKVLAQQGYTILDLEGHIINKHNVDHPIKPKYEYSRGDKVSRDAPDR